MNPSAPWAKLVRMTSSKKSILPKNSPSEPRPWILQDAKARFSELVRAVKLEGPQLVTVRGKDEVVVIAVEEFRRLKGNRTGQDLVEAMRAAPSGIRLAKPIRSPVRDVDL